MWTALESESFTWHLCESLGDILTGYNKFIYIKNSSVFHKNGFEIIIKDS